MQTPNTIDTQDIWLSLQTKPQQTLSGLPELSSQTFALTQFLKNTPPAYSNAAILWCLGTSSERDRAALLLQFWQQHFSHPYTIYTTKEAQSPWLLPLLHNKPLLLLTTPSDVEKKLPLALPTTQEVVTIGQKLSTLKIRNTLQQLAYIELPTADEPGSYSIRGSVIDIKPFGYDESLLRITLDNTAVETINEVYAEKSLPLESITLPIIDTNGTHIYEWLNKAAVCVYNEHAPIQPYILKKLPAKKIILSSYTADAAWQCGFQIFPKKLPASEIEKRLQQKPINSILSTTTNKDDRIQTLPAFPYIEHWYSEAFRTLCVINPATSKKHSSTKRTKLLLSSLKPGEYVVHQDHGLGRFTGMITNTIDDIANEYLQLTYAKGDKLYVPPYQIHKLTKYIGEAHPKLQSLSGSTWPTMVKKIREETIHVAHEIIALSAKRQLASLPPLAEHPQEAEIAADFSYELTEDQITAWEAITDDLASGTPMDRLLCGDVGFGKTEIALRTAFRAVCAGKQVAILAPTTILVQQHFDTFTKRLTKYGVRVAALSRWESKKEQADIVKKITAGDIDIVIGTHRLLSSDVQFQNLSLLIIDEEQKFGVKAKEVLRTKRPQLHTLSLSATPIPRTLNYSLSGIRDISLIQTPPPGRLPITTTVTPHDDATIKQALTTELARSGQIYYLVRKVKEIRVVVAQLEKLMPKARIGIAHGSLAPKELAQVMKNFDEGAIDILVASTIIENGLDVANANTLIVDNAAQFGLAQLYQLRGRIGRSEKQGYAYLLFQRQKLTGIAAKRLEALQAAYELGAGFDVAVRDLEIRGAGNLLGKEQHGQITAVGLALYNQLLEEAVAHESHSDDLLPRIDTTIDIPIPATLEQEPDMPLHERLRVYQELAFATNLSELEKTADKLLPKPRSQSATNIVLINMLRLLCQTIGVYAVDAVVLSRNPFAANIKLAFTPDADKAIVRKLLKENDDFVFDGTALKIKTSHLGRDWLAKLVGLLNEVNVVL